MTTWPLGLALVCAATLTGCNNRQSVIVPNRVLDRPTETALACVYRDPDTEVITTTSLEACNAASCGDTRLIGFIANSERDDVAMFSTCANAVIDMDVATPGAQLIPSGRVPTTMAMTTGSPDACFAISGNLGSCDLSVFDVTGFAAYAWDEAPAEDPSSLVQTIVPTRGDGTPLGARPGQIVPVPLELTNAVLFGDPSPVAESSEGGDDEADADDGGGDGSGTATSGGGGEEGGSAPVLRCDPERPGSVYVTFPSCQLVAEIDLRTHRILQSRQFVRVGEDVEVVDAGVDPECPVDCPEQFIDYPDVLAAAPSGEADGMYPGALALVSPPRIDPENPDAALLYDEADKQVVDHSLYVGGLGDDSVFELRYDGTRWTDDALALELQDASGIQVIRPTPAMELPLDGSDPYHQFLYIITGDGSTRVVRREFDPNRTELGLECDTQVDPTAVLGRVCHPAEFPGENPPHRRPFARGPGIRTADRALITDWTFQKLISCEEGQGTGKAKTVPPFPRYCLDVAATSDETAALSSPFGQVGVVGVGTTSYGRLVYVTFGQFFTKSDGTIGRNPVVSSLVDPLGLLDATILPHMLWPTLDPTLPEVDPLGLPLMDNSAPVRVLPGKLDDADAIKALSPALRRVDMAYTGRSLACDRPSDCVSAVCGDKAKEDADVYADCVDKLCEGKPCVCTDDDPDSCEDQVHCTGGKCEASQLATVANVDTFGNPDAGETGERGLYTKEVVRAVVRDYAAWSDIEWALQWEGEIPGTESVQGQFVCEKPGWEGGTCLSTEPGDTRIVDATADFCNQGVLAGDRLALYACDADSQCGEGQYCLVDPRTPGNASGICVSQEAYGSTDYLLKVCEDMVYDPCGPPRREFQITRAFKDELWLQAMDRPFTSYLMFSEDGAEQDLCSGEYIDHVVQNPDDHPTDPDLLEAKYVECQERLKCAADQPESGCESHADCVNQSREDDGPNDPQAFGPDIYPLCVDGMCRRVCGPDEDCAVRRLPGPACMRELLHYTVTTRNSFVLRGQGQYTFLADRVRTDPESGECYDDSSMSNLLTSRIRVGSDEADTRNNTAWPIPSCPPGTERPDGGAPNPCFIEVNRPENLTDNDPQRLFHRLLYGNQPVPAIRFSNPMMSVVLDLTSVQALTDSIPGREGRPWPASYREFKRSRIPRNFTESFVTRAGYKPFNVGVVTSNIALVGPTRIINAPEATTVFIVDTSGGGGTGGVRGQLVRVALAGGQVSPDTNFQVH